MGLIRGREIQDLIERSTGELCPCKVGRGCPLEPAKRVPPTMPTQRTAS